MGMSDAYLSYIANQGAIVATHLSIIDDSDEDIVRIALDGEDGRPSWTSAGSGGDDEGTIRLSGDYTFSIPAGTTVKGWRVYNQAAEEGQIAWGGEDFEAAVPYSISGFLVLLSSGTCIKHKLPTP